MKARGLEQLGAELCARLGVEHTRPDKSEAGLDSMRFRIDGFDVWLMHAPSVHEGVVSVIVDCGVVPDPPSELRAWMGLLDANYQSSGERAPQYCRDPVSGAVMLQRACGTSEHPVEDLHSHVRDMLRTASEWRVRHTRGQP